MYYICANLSLLDLWLHNDKGKAARPWLTVIMDDYSRTVAGYFLSFAAPCALQTALALHQAIWRKANPLWHICGIPSMLYTDHGSDFTSQHLEQVCADLKIRLVFSQVGQPRGRGRIERFFETVNQMLLPHLAGYAPRGSPSPQPGLTLPQFNLAFEQFIQQYHAQPHSATGIAPQTRWDADGFLPRMPQSLEELDLLLLTVVKTRRVHQDGIRFQGLRYLDLTLSAYVGESVIIRYDPRDMAEIRVYHNDRFLCRAICPELASTTISLKEIVTARNRRRQELKKQLSEKTAFVDALTHPVPQATAQALPVSPPLPPPSSLKRYANDD